jgi:Ca-activated chloride channel family protein
MRTFLLKTLYLSADILLFVFFFAGTWTDIFRSVPERAEQAYNKKDYAKALELYQEAQTRNPDSDTLSYNLGNTFYQLGKYEEAAKQYGRILEKESPAVAPPSLYNMGNTLFQMGRQTQNQEFLQKSLKAYKQSIKVRPEDEDAKYNYELVKRFLKEQEKKQQQNQEQQDKEKKNQEKQKQQKEQQKEEQKKQEQKPQQQMQQQEQRKEQPQPGQMTKEEAERILDALINMEKEMQQKERERKVRAQKRGPDW